MGSGFKDWAAGDVLTAADVDGYLMRQTVMTFADASARDTALSGVLDEGMVAYLEDVNALTVYNGSAWVAVIDSDVLTVDTTNNRVGINDSSPSYALDVTGDINASADLRIGGTTIGETTAYTPTISAVGGSGYTFTLTEAQYAQVNELYVAWFNFSITAGTGAGEFNVTLPTARASVIAGNARELSVNGLTWTAFGTGTSTEARFARYDNAGSLASGQQYSGFAIFGA